MSSIFRKTPQDHVKNSKNTILFKKISCIFVRQLIVFFYFLFFYNCGLLSYSINESFIFVQFKSQCEKNIHNHIQLVWGKKPKRISVEILKWKMECSHDLLIQNGIGSVFWALLLIGSKSRHISWAAAAGPEEDDRSLAAPSLEEMFPSKTYADTVGGSVHSYWPHVPHTQNPFIVWRVLPWQTSAFNLIIRILFITDNFRYRALNLLW